MGEFKIEKGIPMPGKFKYPFHDMEVGDSFKFSDIKRNSVAVYAYKIGKQHGKVFAIRQIDENTFRVWRTA